MCVIVSVFLCVSVSVCLCVSFNVCACVSLSPPVDVKISGCSLRATVWGVPKLVTRIASTTWDNNIFAVSGPTEHCSIFHFPPPPFVLLRHRRDISTLLDNLMI